MLKTQRCVRAPLSELEFHVATPDQAQSRRVSFSRRTGVAQLEINEAATAWKSVYEEHHRSLESSANESGLKAASRLVPFEDAEADDISINEPAPPPDVRPLEMHSDTDAIQLFRLETNPATLRDLPEDPDELRRDLALAREPKRDNISEISIDVDFNADMSITETIRSPAVAATKKLQLDFSVAAIKADTENIAELACGYEDILVFDGKKCKFQSKLNLSDEPILAGSTSERVTLPVKENNISKNKSVFLDDMTETQAILQNNSQAEPQRPVVFDNDITGDISTTQAVGIGTNIIDLKASNIFIQQDDKENKKNMYFNDITDMSVTQALPADVIEKDPQRKKTIGYGAEESLLGANKLDNTRRRTIAYDNADVSMTGVVHKQEDKMGDKLAVDFDNTEKKASMAGALLPKILDNSKSGQPQDEERRKTIVCGNNDANFSMTSVLPANILHKGANLSQLLNGERRKTIVYRNDNVSLTEIQPQQPPNTEFRRTIIYGNDDVDISMIGILSTNTLGKERNGANNTKSVDKDRRRTVVYNNDEENVSITGIFPNNIVGLETDERCKTIVYEDSDVSMTGTVPAQIMAADNNVLEPDKLSSILCKITEQIQQIPEFNSGDNQIEMLDAVSKLQLIESDENADASMSRGTTDRRQSLANNLCSTTLNKSLADQMGSTTFNKSLTAQVGSTTINKSLGNHQGTTTFNQSLADQVGSTTFDKSLGVLVLSTTFSKSSGDQMGPTLFNKSMADQVGSTTFNKFLAGQIGSTTFNNSLADQMGSTAFNKSLADEMGSTTYNKYLAEQMGSTTFSKSLLERVCSTTSVKSVANQDSSTILNNLLPQSATVQACSTTINKCLTSQVLVYGATTESQKIGGDTHALVNNINREHNQSQNTSHNASMVMSNSSADHSLHERSPAELVEPLAVVDRTSAQNALLDMSQASVEELRNELPRVRNTTLLAIDVNVTNSVPTDCDEKLVSKDSEIPAIEGAGPLAIEYKKQKHGIACKLQHKFHELKDTLHIKEKSLKRKPKPYTDDKKENTKKSSGTSNATYDNSLENSVVPKNAFRISSTSDRPDAQENNKSVKIFLTSKVTTDDDAPKQEEQAQQVDVTSKMKRKNQSQNITEINTTKYQADDTRAVLDALSDFTDTRRSNDFEAVPSPERIRRTSAPDRKSLVISKDELLREISMDQALMKTEIQQTEKELEATEDSSDEQEPVPPRLNGEVVKTLRFEDDESILESKVLQKPSAVQPSPRRTPTVIPIYDMSEPVKELMNDLMKPMVNEHLHLYMQPSLPSRSVQADNLESSQIDLIPSHPVFVEPRPCIRRTEHGVAHSEMHVDSPPPKPVVNEPVIVFDHLNPLNNIVLPPFDQGVVNAYYPRRSEESISPSLDSCCMQTESLQPHDVEIHTVLITRTVDRGVGSERDVRDAAVNTSIVKKVNRELLAPSSSLKLVDYALATGLRMRNRAPVHGNYQLKEHYSSVQQGSYLTSGGSSERRRQKQKRPRVAARIAEVTPKPAIKMQKVSPNSKTSRKLRSMSAEHAAPEKETSVAINCGLQNRAPVHVNFQLNEHYSSVQQGSYLTSGGGSERRRLKQKRPRVATRVAEVTPKPAIKMQKVSTNSKTSRKLSSISAEHAAPAKETSVAIKCGPTVKTVAQLYACAGSYTSATSRSSRVSDWRPELFHDTSSKNLISEHEPGVNVVAKIDVLPFMGTSECEWESRSGDTWSFRLLRARLRLLVRLKHRATNSTRVLVRADTPVRLALVQYAVQDQYHSDPVASLCLCLAAETLQRMCGRGVAHAGAVPTLLRRCAAVAKVALRWGRAVRAARAALAFSLADNGQLSLKVANIPLRSVWEVTFRIELCDNGREISFPRAADVRVTKIVALWAPSYKHVQALVDAVPDDWGHVPKTIWKMYKYLKNKSPEDYLLAA